MKIMKATTARKLTIEAIKEKRTRMLDMMNTRIMNNISSGKFECNFVIDSPDIKDEVFDYFTSLGYVVHFSHVSNSNNRIITVSWEDAVQ